jgi:hypothetical protein
MTIDWLLSRGSCRRTRDLFADFTLDLRGGLRRGTTAQFAYQMPHPNSTA